MDIRPVGICRLVWWVQMWEFWFQSPWLWETQSRWTDVLRKCRSHREAWRRRCFAGNTLSDLFRFQGILNHHVYHSILQRYTIPSGLHLLGLSFVFQQDNDPKHTSRLCKGCLTKERDGVLHQMTWPPQSPNLNPIEMIRDELERSVKEKQPTNSQHMSEIHQDCWKSIPHKSGWENAKCAKLSSRQRVATLNNLKYKNIFWCFNTFLLTTWFHMCYLIVSMSSLLFYNVEHSKNKEKPLNEEVCPNLWLVLCVCEWLREIRERERLRMTGFPCF